MKVDDHFFKLPLDLTMVHTLTGGRDICMQTRRHKELMILSLTTGTSGTLCAAFQSKGAALTLCFHSISDRTGITQPVGIGCPY